MGKLKVFQVRFSSPNEVFFPGSSISGDLFVQLERPMNIKALKLEFVGKAIVDWSGTPAIGSREDRRTETRHYSAAQNLFDQTVVVYGEGSTTAGDFLPKGHHTFPFNFQLPNPLPSSFEGKMGYVRYHIRGTIVKSWKSDRHTNRVITVLDMLDLNAIPNALTPAIGQQSEYVCCCCCESGPITLEFSTDRTGYVPEEWIVINATVKNESTSEVEATSAQLMQKVTYHATEKSRSVFKSLARIDSGGCNKRDSLTWTNKRLHIPPIPPSELNHCHIIDIEYFIQFDIRVETCTADMRELVPIIIGTIPLRNLADYQNPPQPADVSAFVTPLPSAPAISSVSPQNITAPPPPSYAAAVGYGFCIKDENDTENTMGDSTSTPQYTFYDWNQSASVYN